MARNKQKKNSLNGILIGSGISTVVIIIIAVALYIKLGPPPADNATEVSNEKNLVKQELVTTGLPSLGDGPKGSDATAATLFTAVNKSRALIRGGGVPIEDKLEASQPAIAALKGVSNGGMGSGFLDNRIEPKYFDSKDARQDFEAISKTVTINIDYHLEKFEFDQARENALAYLALGQQCFENNVRLSSRRRGMAIMKAALNKLTNIAFAEFNDGETDDDQFKQATTDIKAWYDAIDVVDKAWTKKLESIDTVNPKLGLPNIADLENIATHDADPTFRIFATLRLGFAKYERSLQAGAVDKALAKLKEHEDPQVVKAANEASSITSAEYGELRK